MNDNLDRTRFVHVKLREDIERISRLLQPPYADFYEQVERAMRPIRQHHLEIAGIVATSDVASALLDDVSKANQHLLGMLEGAPASAKILNDLNRVHKTWIDHLNPLEDQIAQLQAKATFSVVGVADRLTVSEKLLAGIETERIRRALARHIPDLQLFQNAILGMNANFGLLTGSIESLLELTKLPSFTVTGATREVFAAGYAFEVLNQSRGHEPEDEVIELVLEVEEEASISVALLQKVDPSLATPYAGARVALRSGNPDRARHILSSLREVWNHLLRQIAPDDLVLAWVPPDQSELLHKGRPTRRARILYVCRELNHEPLSDFVVEDTKALVTMVEFFNRVHQLESGLTDEQLRALLLRTDSWLTYILNIWEGSK